MDEIRKRKFLSQVQFQKLLSYIKSPADLAREKGTTRAIVDELIVLLLVRSGLRANEIHALKIEDLPIIHGKMVLRIRSTKGEKVRIVDITQDIGQLLTRFIRLYRKGAKKKDSLLETERGNPFGYMNLYSKVRRIGERAGIGKLTPAMLKHTYMVQLYETEQDLRYVQEQTGYISQRTLAKYLMKGHSKKTSVRRRSIELIKQGPAKQKAGHLKHNRTCEACGAKCTTGRGRAIESGQFLCQECLAYFQTG